MGKMVLSQQDQSSGLSATGLQALMCAFGGGCKQNNSPDR
jgi:hypothetical protein